MRLLIPTPLRPFTGQVASVELAPGAVSDLLAALVERHRDVQKHLFRDDGALRSFVNVYVNDADIRHLQVWRRR